MEQVKSDGTNRLQLESQRMEDRLRMLKQMMSVEKAQRETNTIEDKPHWQSGKRGPLTVKKTNTAVTNKTVEEKLKLNLLKKPLKVSVLTGKEIDPVTQEKVRCGQCDKYHASMICVECVENYCNLCFVKFHHKGSLSKHHVRPLTKVKERSYPSKQQRETQSTVVDDGGRMLYREEQSLLTGKYDETASAAMFQEALKVWRNPIKQDDTTTTITSKSCGVQATDSNESVDHIVERFTSSSDPSTYFEKLLLKRVKTNPSFFTSISPRIASVERIDDEDEIMVTSQFPAVISPYNIFYTSNDGMPETIRTHDSVNLSPLQTTSIEEFNIITQSNDSQQKQDVPMTIKPRADPPAPPPVSRPKAVKGVSKKAIKPAVPKKVAPNKRGSTPNITANILIPSLTTRSLSGSALNASVEKLWRDHSQRVTYHDLSCLFLTSVNPSSNNTTTNVTKDDDSLTNSTDWIMSTPAGVWLPTTSTCESVENNHFSQLDLPPPSNANPSLSRSSYSSDSESEGNQTRLIWEEEEEGQESEEEDEELVRELTSTLYLSAEENKEEEEEERVWSRMTLEDLIHDFDMFQDQVRQQDDDEHAM